MQDTIIFTIKKKKINFKSYKTGKKYKTFHHLAYKSQAIICLFQCKICVTQYGGKSETTFSVSLKNLQKDSIARKEMQFYSAHISKTRNAKFIIIEQTNLFPRKTLGST